VDFFISYTGVDAEWAEWIAWLLEDAGYTTRIQAWDFTAGSNFVGEMHQGAQDSARTIAVLSNAYLTSDYAKAEWQAAWVGDPSGRVRKLLAVRTEDCARPGLLNSLVTVDLFGVDRETAARRLLTAAHGARGKPAAEPAFPGAARPSVTPPKAEPAFPGEKCPPATPERRRQPRAWRTRHAGHARRIRHGRRSRHAERMRHGRRTQRRVVNTAACVGALTILVFVITFVACGGDGSGPGVHSEARPRFPVRVPEPQSAPTASGERSVVTGQPDTLTGATPSQGVRGPGAPESGARGPGASAGSARPNPGPMGTSTSEPAAPVGSAETTSQQAPASQAGRTASQAGPPTQPAASPTPTSGCKDGVPLSPLLGTLGLVHC
jgi:hypothetical protein